jgi:hypothetical protein
MEVAAEWRTAVPGSGLVGQLRQGAAVMKGTTLMIHFTQYMLWY